MSTEDVPSLLELGILHEEVRELQGALAEVEDRRRAAAVAAGVTRQTLDKWLGDWKRKR